MFVGAELVALQTTAVSYSPVRCAVPTEMLPSLFVRLARLLKYSRVVTSG
jgi:hypothetical protein